MSDKRKITVEIPQKSYNLIRLRSQSPEIKTSRVLSRYLFVFLKILSDGERTLFKKFSQRQARSLAVILNSVHHADRVSWDELATYPAKNLSMLVDLFDDTHSLPLSTICGLNSWEIIALMEYAQIDDSEQFEAQTARFCG